MKITVVHDRQAGENELVLHCGELDEECLYILSLLEQRNRRLAVLGAGRAELRYLTPGDALYAESVDGKTFVYLKDEVCECPLALFELEARFADAGFVRISKGSVVNLYRVRSLKSGLSGRIEITVDSGEHLIVSRRYAATVRARLGD